MTTILDKLIADYEEEKEEIEYAFTNTLMNRESRLLMYKRRENVLEKLKFYNILNKRSDKHE